MTQIISNGSQWAGNKPVGIELLLQVLRTHTLEERFFFKRKSRVNLDTGEFEWVILCPIKKCRESGRYHFFGNFEDLSFVFNIYTADPEVIRTLKAAIMANEGWKKYLVNLKKKA